MKRYVFLNDRVVPADEAAVPVSNPAFLHGVGLFETMRSYDGTVFRLNQHVERMRASAQSLHMPIDEVIDRIPHAVDQLMKAGELRNARLRVTATPPGIQPESEQPTLLVVGEETAGYPRESYERGMTVLLCTDFRQSRSDPLCGHKTTSYLPRLLALRNAQNQHCGEALWFTPMNLLGEGCISNVFLVKDGRLRTPPLETPVLPGITRAAVIECARVQKVVVVEAPCTADELFDADEVFLTNAVMEVMPVTRIERHPIADEKPGAITTALADAYQALTMD